LTAVLAGRGALLGTLLLAVLAVVPFLMGSSYVYTLGLTICTFAILAAGLNLVYGFVGLLSLAQVAFFGIGGYATAILVVEQDWVIWPALVAAALISAAAGIVVAYASLRLSRHAFAIVSLVFTLLCLIIARDWVELTRGPMGMPGLPAPTLDLPLLEPVVIDRPNAFYPVMLFYAVIVLLLFHRIMRSRIGRTMLAIRYNEPLAQSMGVNPLAFRLFAIGLSAAVTGAAGGLFVFHLSIVDPSIFDFYYLESMLIMVVVGGPGSFWGVLYASVVFSALPDLLRFGNDLRLVLYGIVLIAAILLLPGGVAGFVRRRQLRHWREAVR
jgi:branched-chain amino acid transport system permease protein